MYEESRCSGLAHGRPSSREGRVECPELVEGLSTSEGLKVKSPDFPSVNSPVAHLDKVFVYILLLSNGAFYVGHAGDVARRVTQHRSGKGAKFTHDHDVAQLIYCEGPMDVSSGVLREAQLKRWSRAKKEALIRGDRDALKTLSRSRASRPASAGASLHT
jgi:putative endonuclease